MRCILVDDDPTAIQILRKLCSQYNECNIVADFQSADLAFEFLQKHEVDVLFLDITMPGKSGMELAKAIMNMNIQVVFITGETEYALSAFELNATDYIKKPITKERFDLAVQKVIQRHNILNVSSSETITLKTAVSNVQIPLRDIVFVHSDKGWLNVHTISGKVYMSYMGFAQIEELLPAKSFFRVHNRYIVNLKQVKEIYANSIKLPLLEVPISRQRKKEFLETYNMYKMVN